MGTKTIAIVNYGMGNIGSVANALAYLGGDYFVTSEKDDLQQADGYILPGVGAFGAAIENIRRLDLEIELTEQVLIKKKPFLGICLGMQLVAKDSVEQGFHTGFGWIDAHVLALEPVANLRVPHVGWNNLEDVEKKPLFTRIDDGAHFYFDHCFHLECNDDIVVARCEYGGVFVAAIQQQNILATQFHPEKSQRNGLKLLRNFLNFVDTY